MRLAILLSAVAPCLCQAGQAPAEDLFAQVAEEKGVSARLLYAIALTESGHEGRPWPWTLNVDGRSFYYASRESAHTALVTLLRRGFRSVDVGYMQVNLAQHGARLGNTWLALDPYRNLSVAAEILRENYGECADVRRAVAYYHSRTPWRADRYLRTVTGHYARLAQLEMR